MMGAKFSILILPLFIISCSGNVLVTSKGLNGHIPLSLEREMRTLKYPRNSVVENFEIKKEIWLPIPGVTRQVRIADVLKEAKIDPQKILHLNYYIESDWGDTIRNIFPFIGAKTVVIRGYSEEFETLNFKK